MRVRPAAVDDAEGIARVHVAGWQAAYRGLLPPEYLEGLRWEQRYDRWHRDLLAPVTPGRRTWVIDDARGVLGFTSTGPARDDDRASPGAWELYALYLEPQLWGQGWGAALTSAAVDGLPESAVDISLWVLEGNHVARRFYERYGFTRDGHAKLDSLAGTTIAEVRYLLELATPRHHSTDPIPPA